MPFTDAELKIRKRRAYNSLLSAPVQDFQNEDMLNLLARLTAAEEALNSMEIQDDLQNLLVEKWLKAAGK